MFLLFSETERQRKNKQHSREKLSKQREENLFTPSINEEDIAREFQSQTEQIQHKHCCICKSVCVFLTTEYLPNGQQVCKTCKKFANLNLTPEELHLPIWRDENNKVHYELPEELSSLRPGECLLIQQISVYIPLFHIKEGQTGIQGNVCAFFQAIDEICKVLPRTNKDVNFIKVIKYFRNKLNHTEGTKTFMIRRNYVIRALIWLKKYNVEYKDITIDESNLNWMGDEEEKELLTEQTLYEEYDNEETDLGPSQTQIFNEEEGQHLFKSYAMVSDNNIGLPKQKDKEITDKIKQSIDKSTKGNEINFPYVSEEPIDEFDENIKLFCKAFPWLYPGGIGDFNEFSNQSITLQNYFTQQLHYHDARFAKDKIWAFYAYNYLQRHNNMKQGGYFIDGFFKNGPETIDELQQEIEQGKTSWIDHITYFSQRIPGSSAYWRNQRSQVYTWINHHIEEGHGAPAMFITLSCAEYHWPDIKRLLIDRFKTVGITPP